MGDAEEVRSLARPTASLLRLTVVLIRITFVDPNKKTRNWESAERLTRPKGSEVDGVGIVAVLEKAGHAPELLLQKQFRPPIDKICIEVPAGLVDSGETPEQSAVRELKEETGYIGVAVEDGAFAKSPVMYNDPGFCNTNLHMVHVTVNMEDEENKKPKPELEENEFIECFTVPLKDLYEECRRFEKEGFAIDARVGTLAEGIEVAKRWKLT